MEVYPLNDPAGDDTQIQINDGGILGASTHLTLNKTTGVTTATGLTVTNCAVLGSNSAEFKPNADAVDFFKVNDKDGNNILTIDTVNDAWLPTTTKLGTIIGSYNFINGSAFGSDNGYTYCTANGSAIANSVTGNVYYNNLIGASIANAAETNIYRNNIVGSTLANKAKVTVSYNNIVGSNLAANTDGSVIYNNIVGSALANAAATNIFYNNIVGYTIGGAAVADFYRNNLVGSNLANAAVGNISYNNIVGTYLVNAAEGAISYNNVIGSYIANKAEGNVYYSNMVGNNIIPEITGNVYRTNIVGYNILADATGAITDATFYGSELGNAVTGDVTAVFSIGASNLYNTTNVVNLNRIIALPVDALRESSAADLDDSIAIGYRAGYQNAYNSPALFGRSAVSEANMQMVFGSDFYTGGIRLVTQGGAFTLEDLTHSDAVTSGSTISFKRERSGGEKTTPATIAGLHESTGDDTKGRVVIATDSGAGLVDALTIDSAQMTTATGLTVTNCAVLGSNSAVFQPAADSTTFFGVNDKDGNNILTIDTVNNAWLPTTTKLGTIEGSYNFINGTAFGSKSGYTYCLALGTNIGGSASGEVYRNNCIGTNIGNTVGTNFFAINAVGYNIANSAQTSFYYCNAVGYGLANASEGSVYSCNLVGDNIASTTTGNVYSCNLVGDNIASTTTGNVYRNNAVGSEFADGCTTGDIYYNNAVGRKLAGACTGNIIANNLVGYQLADAAEGIVYYNHLVGYNIFLNATGNILRNYAVGSGLGSGASVTGNVQDCFFSGDDCASSITNATELLRVIAFPSGTLKGSSATTLNDAIAIGTEAGLNNTYNSPALFGKGAVADAHNQMALGSSFYTGGVRVVAGSSDFTLENLTHSDADGAGVIVSFKRERSGGEVTTPATISGVHDGAADDTKGKVVIATDSGAGLTTALTIDSTQLATFAVGTMFNNSVDSAAVADEVTLGGYEIGAGQRALAISQEYDAIAEVDETKFSHKLPVRINGSTYYIMLTAT